MSGDEEEEEEEEEEEGEVGVACGSSNNLDFVSCGHKQSSKQLRPVPICFKTFLHSSISKTSVLSSSIHPSVCPSFILSLHLKVGYGEKARLPRRCLLINDGELSSQIDSH